MGQGIITCNHEWWEGVCGGGGNVIATKKVRQPFLNQSWDLPPNQKFLDPPLGVSFSGVSYL